MRCFQRTQVTGQPMNTSQWKPCPGVIRTQASQRPALTQSTESPILFRSYGHEIQCSDQKWASKIGDSVLWSERLGQRYEDILMQSPMRYPKTRQSLVRPEHGIPDFDASFWPENGVSCPQCGHERNKIGDSVLWVRRYVVWNVGEFSGQYRLGDCIKMSS